MILALSVLAVIAMAAVMLRLAALDAADEAERKRQDDELDAQHRRIVRFADDAIARLRNRP